MNDIRIRKASGGYIITDRFGLEQVLVTLQQVFEYLLLHYEGRGSTITGDSHGEVVIKRGIGEV